MALLFAGFAAATLVRVACAIAACALAGTPAYLSHYEGTRVLGATARAMNRQRELEYLSAVVLRIGGEYRCEGGRNAIYPHTCVYTHAHFHTHARTPPPVAATLADERKGCATPLARSPCGTPSPVGVRCRAVRCGDGRCLQRSWLRWWLLLEPYAAGVLPSAIALGCFAVSLGASGVALAQLPGVSRLWYMPALQTVRGVCNLDGQRRSDALQSARSTFALCAALHLLAEAAVRTLPWSVRAWRRMAADVAVVASLAWTLPLVLVLGLLLMAENTAVLGLCRVRPEYS